jgi:hypothetical protein
MNKRLGELINEFDNLEEQTVRTFNQLFPMAKLGKLVLNREGRAEFISYPEHWTVEILDMAHANTRNIKLNNLKTIKHVMEPFKPVNRGRDGKPRAVVIDGVHFDSVADALRHYGIKSHQFPMMFKKVAPNEYVKKNS